MIRHAVTVAFLGLCAFLGGMVAQSPPRSAFAKESPLAIQTKRTTDAQTVAQIKAVESAFADVANQLSPSVVDVEAVKPAEPRNRTSRTTEESGSGVIVKLSRFKGAFVLTNNHVVAKAGASQITIKLSDGRILKPTRVWADPESDIAVLQLPETKRLTIAELGNSDQLRVGQWVIAIGSPFGLTQTVTHGILSARGRGQVSLGETIRIKDFLQTDAAINPGSSGGPLFNLDGEVIGINTAIASNSGSNSGVAFSIPINLVERVAEELLTRGFVARGYIGLQVAESFDTNDALRLGLTKAQGAWVETILPNAPASTGGVRANDVVLEVNGLAIRDQNHFINLISSLPPGREVNLRLWRNRGITNAKVTIGDWRKAREELRSR